LRLPRWISWIKAREGRKEMGEGKDGGRGMWREGIKMGKEDKEPFIGKGGLAPAK